MVCAADRISDHVGWTVAFGDARKVHRGCRGHLLVLRHRQCRHCFSEEPTANPDARRGEADNRPFLDGSAAHRRQIRAPRECDSFGVES